MAKIEDIEKFNYKSIQLPDNATNGDVIKTLFPNATIRRTKEHRQGGWHYRPQIVLRFSETEINYFNEDWWNAPFMQPCEQSKNEKG